MGSMSDRDLAARLGLSLFAVQSHRWLICAPAANPRRAWTADEEVLLGTRPDAELARQLKRTVLGVATRRRTLQIPPIDDARGRNRR
jgi:hypothetical protein